MTADHGNAEKLLEDDGQPAHGAHDESGPARPHEGPTSLAERGRALDLAPTVLDLLGLEQPVAMTGSSLVER